MIAQSVPETETARQSLIAICEHLKPTLNGQGSEKFHQDIADKLSAIAGKQPPWTHRYIVSVRNGKTDPSQSMIWAIKALGYMLDDGSPLVARSQAVNVLAYGDVRPNAVILADSRPCAYPGCTLHFVPRVPWQRFCSPTCRDKNRRAMRGDL